MNEKEIFDDGLNRTMNLLDRVKELEQQKAELIMACKSMSNFIKLNSWGVPVDIKTMLEKYLEE